MNKYLTLELVFFSKPSEISELQLSFSTLHFTWTPNNDFDLAAIYYNNKHHGQKSFFFIISIIKVLYYFLHLLLDKINQPF